LDSGKSFDLERHAGFARLVLNPSLNAYHWADIERSAAEILTSLETAKASGVIVDLSSLDYLGSAQLTLLVRIWKAIKASGGRMIVLVTAPVVREVINTAGLSTLWEFTDSLADAYQKLGLRSDGGTRMTMLLPFVGVVALMGAIAGLCATLFRAGNLDARLSLLLQLGFSGVALAVGVWMVIRGTGMRKKFGIAMVAASLILTVLEIMNAPLAGSAPPEQKSEAAGAEKTESAEKAGAEKEDADSGKGADAAPAKGDATKTAEPKKAAEE
jgi:anti-anti-sigma factor